MPCYRIPLPPGGYRVTLHFAEIHFKVEGERIFDVLLEGETVLKNLDLFKKAGYATAYKVEREVRVEDGLLDILFVPKIDNPVISAIEVEKLRN